MLKEFRASPATSSYAEGVLETLTEHVCAVTQQANDSLRGSDTALTTADKEVSEEDIYSGK